MMLSQKPKSLREWVEIYKKRAGGEPVIADGFQLFYLPTRGFAILKIEEEASMIIVSELCGDCQFWRDVAELIASTFNLDYISAICTRHIKPYIRGFNWEIMKDEVVNGQHRYHCQDSIGRLVLCTYKGDAEDGTPHYYVTHYLNKKYSEGSEL